MKLPAYAQRAWNRATIVRGRSLKLYRRDQFGNIVFSNSYGKKTPMGWHVVNGQVEAIELWRSEDVVQGKSVDLGGRRIIKKKNESKK